MNYGIAPFKKKEHKMPGPLGMIAAAAGGQILGMMNDERQQRANRQNTANQLQANIAMSNHNLKNQKDLWEYTGYENQVRQMKAANINPAYLLGKGGAGGQTAAAVGGGGIGMASGPSSGGEGLGMIQANMQNMMMKAQIDNLNADTEKKKVEATKTGGVDTKLGETQIASITQGIANQQAAEELTKTQDRIARVSAEVGEGTIHEQIGEITYAMRYMSEKANQLVTSNSVDRQTMNSKIEILKQEALEAAVKVTLANAKVKNTEVNTEMMGAEIRKWVKEMEQRNQMLLNEGRRVSLEEIRTSAERAFKEELIDNQELQMLIQGAGMILRMGPEQITTRSSTQGPNGGSVGTQRTTKSRW